MKKLSLIVSLLAVCSVAFGQAKVITETIDSKILGTSREYTIILPSSYDSCPDAKYPVLYLLHGMYDNHMAWVNKGNALSEYNRMIGEWLTKEMIIVTPNAGGFDPVNEQNGYFNIPGWTYEDFFFNEFVPFIESTYRGIGDRGHRAIAGLSMGGGGSISYAQRHPEMFCAVYSMSGWLGLTDGEKANPRPGKIVPLEKSVDEHNCANFVKNADEATIEALRTIRWYVDCGDDDFLFVPNINFILAMKDRGVPCEFRVRDGGHTWRYWETALATCFPFVSMTFE